MPAMRSHCWHRFNEYLVAKQQQRCHCWSTTGPLRVTRFAFKVSSDLVPFSINRRLRLLSPRSQVEPGNENSGLLPLVVNGARSQVSLLSFQRLKQIGQEDKFFISMRKRYRRSPIESFQPTSFGFCTGLISSTTSSSKSTLS